MNRAPEAPTLQQAFEAAKRGERCLQCNPSTLTSSAGYWNFWHHVVLLILTSVGRLLLALWNSI
jgi:hypothetical protein